MNQPPDLRNDQLARGRASRYGRTILCATGITLLGCGFALLVPVLRRDPVSAIGWLVAGPLLHDGAVAVAVVAVATLTRRWLPSPWRAPVAAGLVVSMVVLALSVPLWWRPDAGQSNPGVRTDIWPGVLTLIAIIWITVFAVVGIGTLIRRRRETAAAADHPAYGSEE